MSDISGLHGTVRSARAIDAHHQSLTGGVRRFAVDIPLVGIGEATQQIWFPATYCEKPLHSWGFEVIGNADIPEGALPMAAVLIRSWDTDLVEDSELILYRGCRATVKTVAPFMDGTTLSTRFSFSLFFEGRSISMPGRN